MKQNSKMENPTHSFREMNFANKLEVKLWWVGTCKRKDRVFFVAFILSEGNFFNICALSRCIVYWIHFQNIHTFASQKTFLHTHLLLVFKIVECLQWGLPISWNMKTLTRDEGSSYKNFKSYRKAMYIDSNISSSFKRFLKNPAWGINNFPLPMELQ